MFQDNAVKCMKSNELTLFADIINEGVEKDLECNGKLRSKFLIFFEKVSLKSIILGLIIPCITFTFDIPRKNRFFKSIITYLMQTKDMRMIHPNLCNF